MSKARLSPTGLFFCRMSRENGIPCFGHLPEAAAMRSWIKGSAAARSREGSGEQAGRRKVAIAAQEKRLARWRHFVYNTRLWKGSEEAVTRSTRNRVIGDEPVRGFESHPFRQFRY